MSFPRSIIGTRVAIGIALTIGMLSTASAQAPAGGGGQGRGGAQAGGGGQGGGGGRGRGPAAPLYTPAAGAKDLKSVLFNWAWYMGILRSSEERDLLMTLEYQGKGTMQVDGQPLQCDEVSNQHQLPDVRRADSVHGHSAQWPVVLQCRSPQWSVCLERRHSWRRTRPR